jgi:serine/threonine protein kinase
LELEELYSQVETSSGFVDLVDLHRRCIDTNPDNRPQSFQEIISLLLGEAYNGAAQDTGRILKSKSTRLLKRNSNIISSSATKVNKKSSMPNAPVSAAAAKGGLATVRTASGSGVAKPSSTMSAPGLKTSGGASPSTGSSLSGLKKDGSRSEEVEEGLASSSPNLNEVKLRGKDDMRLRKMADPNTKRIRASVSMDDIKSILMEQAEQAGNLVPLTPLAPLAPLAQLEPLSLSDRPVPSRGAVVSLDPPQPCSVEQEFSQISEQLLEDGLRSLKNEVPRSPETPSILKRTPSWASPHSSPHIDRRVQQFASHRKLLDHLVTLPFDGETEMDDEFVLDEEDDEYDETGDESELF